MNPYMIRNQDILLMPQLEAVTFYSRIPTPSNPDAATPYNLTRAGREDIKKNESSAGGGVFEVATITWTIYAEALDYASAPAPKKDDWLIDPAGDKWIFTKVDVLLWATVYECETRKGV